MTHPSGTVFDHGGTLPYADLTGSIVVTERVSDTWQSQDSEIVILFLGLYLIHPIASISVPWIAHGGIVEITVLIKNVTVADSRGVNVAEEMQARLAALNSSTFPGRWTVTSIRALDLINRRTTVD